jgi:D-alanyl-D-alanine dipeptidase
VNVQDLDPTIRVDMKYSTDDNFLGFDVYGSLDKCYLQPDVADKLVKANRYLKEENPLYTLLVYDGARPRSIQRKMWDTVKTMPVKQGTYVSNPNKGSLHNFGAAVDLTVADENGNALDMGTPYDFFGDRAHTDIEARLLSTGEITEEQLANRKLLRRVMNKAGFFGIQSEWWHFNSCTRDAAAQKYTIIE